MRRRELFCGAAVAHAASPAQHKGEREAEASPGARTRGPRPQRRAAKHGEPPDADPQSALAALSLDDVLEPLAQEMRTLQVRTHTLQTSARAFLLTPAARRATRRLSSSCLLRGTAHARRSGDCARICRRCLTNAAACCPKMAKPRWCCRRQHTHFGGKKTGQPWQFACLQIPSVNACALPLSSMQRSKRDARSPRSWRHCARSTARCKARY